MIYGREDMQRFSKALSQQAATSLGTTLGNAVLDKLITIEVGEEIMKRFARSFAPEVVKLEKTL